MKERFLFSVFVTSKFMQTVQKKKQNKPLASGRDGSEYTMTLIQRQYKLTIPT